jgi:hypothetical protein
MLPKVLEIGLGEEFLDAKEGYVEEVGRLLEEEYGGIEAYMDMIEFGKEKREVLRGLLMA